VGIDQLDRGEFSEYDENSLEKFDADIKATENNLFGRESGKS
jgi:hypothetical protein